MLSICPLPIERSNINFLVFVISVKAVIQPSNSTDPGALTQQSSGHSSDPNIEKMIQQVKDVFPQVPFDTIRKDIGKY